MSRMNSIVKSTRKCYDYTWQLFSKNEKFVLFRFFAKNRGAKKRKIDFPMKLFFLGHFPLKNPIFGHFDQTFDDEPYYQQNI